MRAEFAGLCVREPDPAFGAVPPPGLAVFDDQVGWHGMLLVCIWRGR